MSWLEPHFGNMCINACWEFYGAIDSTKNPSTGAEYQLNIDQPQKYNGEQETNQDRIGDRTKDDSNNKAFQSYYNHSDEPTKTVSSLKAPEDYYKLQPGNKTRAMVYVPLVAFLKPTVNNGK